MVPMWMVTTLGSWTCLLIGWKGLRQDTNTSGDVTSPGPEDLAILDDSDKDEGLEGQRWRYHLLPDPMGLIGLCQEHLRHLIWLPIVQLNFSDRSRRSVYTLRFAP